MTIPYSYHLYHSPTQSHYYGIKFAKGCSPDTLWTTYFSSSKKVKELINKYGEDSFEAEIRKIFKTGKEALLWEHRVLTKLDAANKPNWINRHNGGKKFRSPEHHLDTTKQILRKKITGIKRSETCKAKHSTNALLREQTKRDNGWKMPRQSVEQMQQTRAQRISNGEINPYNSSRNSKMAESKKGTKRHYLPDGSFVMRKI